MPENLFPPAHQQYRSSSVYPDLSTVDLHFDFDLELEKAFGGYDLGIPEKTASPWGSETNLRTDRGSSTSDPEKLSAEPYVVFWDGPYDPENPQNWAELRKWTAVSIVSFITFVTCVLLNLYRDRSTNFGD